jgi:phosphoenolpyruvate carboxylase
MNFDSPLALLYHTYNSLFLSLPFNEIEARGTHLALFSQECKSGFRAGKSPVEIVTKFWDEYFEQFDEEQRLALLFYFIQYSERQVVLFDSVEDALFEHMHEMNGPGSIRHFITRLNTPELREKMLQKIQQFSLRLVLTAHPTQFYPGKVLGIMNDLGKEIKGKDLEKIRTLLMQLGKTAFVNRQKPTPYDEAVSLGWYMEHVFYEALPDLVFRLLKALDQPVEHFSNPQLLALGFWPGGDRDGNPFVTAETTLRVAELLREGVLRGYYRDIRKLKRRLTFRGVEEIIALVERKIYHTLYYPNKEHYNNCSELLADLHQARVALLADHDPLFVDQLDLFILKIRMFGFYFASLDIRQNAEKHLEAWQLVQNKWSKQFPWFDAVEFDRLDENTMIDRLLSARYQLDPDLSQDAFLAETIRSFQAIRSIQQNNGELGCHRYIISNCGSALDVARVMALGRLSLPEYGEAPLPLDVVPLFETIDDLAACDEVMRTLYSNQYYMAHLASRGCVQHIMLGFSDGTKDGGYLRANWSIYRAKEALTRVSRAFGITAIFFDGRGGPPGRGGGNNASYYAAHGTEIENQAIHVTIQGQTVSSTYGNHDMAVFNMERLLTAGLENHLFHSPAQELSGDDHALLDELAEAAYKAYLKIKNHAQFVPYLEKMTPLKWYGDSNIASRPTKRNQDGGLRFEDLRAIPFVGAWAQMKQNIPGYHGIGAAISGLPQSKRAALAALYDRSLFFRTLLENSMQSLSKSNFSVTQYLEEHPKFGGFWKILHEEYQLACRELLQLSGQDDLLEYNPRSGESIHLRENIVQPLIAIQQYALQQLQNPKLDDARAEVYRKLVLRAMFGIINAARNAA